MPDFTVMSYNVEWMSDMFDGAAVKADPASQARAQAIAAVITRENPDLLAVCEAANTQQAHQTFIAQFLPGSNYQLAAGVSRGRQDLVMYYRPPFQVASIDKDSDFYEPWTEDVDEDEVDERFRWERKPLEVVFRVGVGGPSLRIVLVHTKSKGVFDVVDLAGFQNLSLGNRKKLAAQASRLRGRLDSLLSAANAIPLIVLGDMNDGPGMDAYEKVLGRSFVEGIMGTVFDPGRVLHNSLWWMTRSAGSRKELWTADFPDPIVQNPKGWRHRVWIDHILVSPDMLTPANPIRYISDSGRIGAKDATARKASDHFPVACTIQT